MPLEAPPAALLADLPAEEQERAGAWWASLGPAARTEFLQLWDERSDDTSLYGVVADGCIRWHELPLELHGSLLDDEDPNGRLERREGRQALLEYISNHDDIGFFFLDGKTFHICRAHPEARARIRAGLIPASFTCPLAERDCPMSAILAEAGGCSVRLEAALVRPLK